MTQRGSSAAQLAVLALFALVAAACGGATIDAVEREPSAQELAILAFAEQNQNELKLVDDFALAEMIDAETGEITSLSEVATGDRAVLIWYWTPN